MHQAKKGNLWRFGMKERIGVDAGSGYCSARLRRWPANVCDVAAASELVRESDKLLYGDSGHLGIEKREKPKKNSRRFDGIEHKASRPASRQLAWQAGSRSASS